MLCIRAVPLLRSACPVVFLPCSRRHFPMPVLAWKRKALSARTSVKHLTQWVTPGGPAKGLRFGSVKECFEHFMGPILRLQERRLVRRGQPHLVPLLMPYTLFNMGLGMAATRRVADVWDPAAFCYNATLAKMLTRRQYFAVRRYGLGSFGTPGPL